MPHERLRFALQQLTPGDWLVFEQFCSEFLVADYPALRTKATPSGDRGRDGELFMLPQVKATGFQYSVTADWAAKIRSTVRTVEANSLGLRRIIYCTNQQIGALGDDLVNSLWEDGIRLDIHDREWFCERELSTSEREAASREIGVRIVDPITSARGISDATGGPLTNSEGKVALVHLALNASDRQGDRNLTKTSFDALVRAALIDTSQYDTLGVDGIIERVRKLVPQGGVNQVADLTRSALARLSKKHGPIKLRSDTGEYHLSYEAAEEWKSSAAEYLLNQRSLEDDLAAAAYGRNATLDEDLALLQEEGSKLRRALEHVMLRSGEGFVAAVEGGDPRHLSQAEISGELGGLDLGLVLNPDESAAAILEVIAGPAERSKAHLVRVLDAYTLLAFLQQTPDVQKTMSKVFTNAKIWLDTSTVLPLIVETLIDEPEFRQQTNLLQAAAASGIGLYVTDGVIEEIRFHLGRCIAYIKHTGRWDGAPPYAYSAYMLSGRDERQFENWLLDFRGDMSPERDLEEYLEYHFKIRRRNLGEIADAADPALRGAVQEFFRQRHYSRRTRQSSDNIIDRLAAHDAENVLGVIGSRTSDRSSLGHEAWWLTLDSAGFRLQGWLRDQLDRDAPESPVLSPDYLSQMLRLGPLRRALGEDAQQLPLVVDVSALEKIPVELVEAARTTRASFQGYDELRIRREVRDSLAQLRTTMRARHDYGSEARSAIEDVIIQQRSARR